jgi:hypothetical protein
VYPAKASYDLSLKKLSDLSDELDAWHAALPHHLRLPFAQDKPTVGTISSRSPIVSLTYHYIRALIQRPAICASLGSKSSSAMLALSSSCKSAVQIIQLLEERGLGFSLCLNKDEVLVLSGFGLLFQRLTLDPNSKILKESQKMVTIITDILTKSQAPCAPEFKKIASACIPITAQSTVTAKPSVAPTPSKVKTTRPASSDGSPQTTSRPHSLQASTKKQLKALASRFTPSVPHKVPDMGSADRRATVASISLHPQAPQTQSQPSLSPQHHADSLHLARSEPALSPNSQYSRPPSTTIRPSAPPQHPQLKPKKRPVPTHMTNLDFFSFNNDSAPQYHSSVAPIKTEPQPSDWEKLLGSLDSNQTNIFDACYGGQPVEALLDTSNYAPPITHRHSTTALHSHSNNASALDWNADLWNLYQTNSNAAAPNPVPDRTAHNPSIWSYSTDEGTTSAEDLTLAAAHSWSGGSSDSSGMHESGDQYPAIVLPELGLNGEDMNFPFNEWGDVGA